VRQQGVDGFPCHASWHDRLETEVLFVLSYDLFLLFALSGLFSIPSSGSDIRVGDNLVLRIPEPLQISPVPLFVGVVDRDPSVVHGFNALQGRG